MEYSYYLHFIVAEIIPMYVFIYVPKEILFSSSSLEQPATRDVRMIQIGVLHPIRLILAYP